MEKIELGKLVEFQRGYDLTKKDTIHGEYKVVSSTGIMAYHNKYKSEKSVVIGRSGTVGIPQLIEEKFWPHNTTLFIKDFKGNDIDYIYYLLLNMNIPKMKTGSNIPTLNRNHLHPIKIYATQNINEQIRISSVLKNIDNYINNIKKENRIIQDYLTAIYKKWFFQFDFPNENGSPYKKSGGKMIWNDYLKREIPIDWECISLGKLLTRNNKKIECIDDIPTIDLSVMPNESFSLDTINISNNFSTNLFEMNMGDILFGSIRPYLKKAGIAPCDGAFAGTVFSSKTKENSDYNFVVITMTNDNFFDFANAISKGTKMPVVGSDDLLDYKIPYNREICEKFNNLLDLKEIICSNIKKILKLTELRDFLIPMLINGQIKI